MDGAAQRAALGGTNTKEIQAGMEKYLGTKRIDNLFTNITESVLLFQPDNPVRYIRQFLVNNYPAECRDEAEKSSSTTLSGKAAAPPTPLQGGPQTDSSGE